MRKLIHSLVLTALTFFAASCQQENLEPVASGNSVTYTIQIPDVLMTKTSVPEKVDSLIYQVYRKDDIDDLTKRPIYTGTADINDAGKAELVMEFVRQQEFIVLFWAQNSTAKVYDIADLREVSIVKEKLSANDFSAEAFSGFDTVKDCVSASNGDVELTRPISQINIITSEDGLTLGQTTQIKLEQSEMIVDGLYDIYNVYNGQVASQGIFAPRYTFTKAYVPTKDFKSGYKYVAMSYVGFAGNASANINVRLDIYTSEGKIHHNVNNIPVKANYRTNILGNLITGNAGYAVTIDKEWASPDAEVVAVAVSTAADLQTAINEIPAGVEGNIQLEGNIDLGTLAGMISTRTETPSYGLLIPAGKTLILDLNGCTLSQEVGCTASYSMIENRGHLTIIDSKSEGKISFNDSGAGDPQFGWGSYTISNQGTLVVNSGTIEHTGKQNTQDNVAHMYCAIQQNNDKAILTVNGGTVSNQTYRSIRINSGKADIKGGNMIGQVWVHPFADNINLNIEGGNFQPTGADGSSVFVTNNEKSVTFSVTGGFFATKISCSVPANLAGTVTGGTFTTSAKENTPADLYAGYHFVQEDEYYILEPCPVKVGETAYGTLNEAVNAVKEGETITILAGKTLSEGAIKLPAILKNVTFSGEEGATLKDMTIMAADGNSYSYDGLTFNAITFDNSRISLTGWRNGDEVIKNLEVTNCIFKNLKDDTNSAPVHINKDAPEAVKNFTFTNNVIDGATGGSKSGVYAQLTGNIEFTGNVINNVSFRPYVIQITTDDGIADKFVVRGNTFSGSSVGRAQGLGNNAEGTDNVTLEVSDNIFKGITNSQQICYWNFNAAKTTVDLSKNYYDIDILANPSKIYYNAAATSEADLAGMNVFPIYTELNADGTINRNSAYSPAPVQIGEAKYNSLEEAVAAAKEGDTISLIDNVTLASELKLPANVILNGNGKQIEGTIYAGGNLTFVGHTKVTSFSASYYNRTITIGEGACLEVTGNGRVTLGYGNTFNITGNLDDAKTADKSKIQPSLIIPGGISITGGSDAIMNVTNAYVQIGSTTSKPGAAGGCFNLKFENSIVEFTKEFGFYEPTGGMNPTFNMELISTVMTIGTKLCIAASNSNVSADNSIIALGTYLRNSGNVELKNGSVLTGKTIQFGENGGNNGAIKVNNSEFTITAGSVAHAFDGKGDGSITVENHATATVDYYKDMTITVDETSTFNTKVQ